LHILLIIMAIDNIVPVVENVNFLSIFFGIDRKSDVSALAVRCCTFMHRKGYFAICRFAT
jgi:hypothetical protein